MVFFTVLGNFQAPTVITLTLVDNYCTCIRWALKMTSDHQMWLLIDLQMDGWKDAIKVRTNQVWKARKCAWKELVFQADSSPKSAFSVGLWDGCHTDFFFTSGGSSLWVERVRVRIWNFHMKELIVIWFSHSHQQQQQPFHPPFEILENRFNYSQLCCFSGLP